MSFQGASYHNHNHPKHQHQHQHHHGLYRTNGYYPEYILESMVTAAPRHQEAYVTFNEERVQEAPTRVRVVEYEYQSPPPRDRYEVCEEKVDREAEEFIKLEHMKFGYYKTK